MTYASDGRAWIDEPCDICGKPTNMQFADGEEYQGSFWSPQETSQVDNRTKCFPITMICSRECLHKFVDECLDTNWVKKREW